MCGEYLYVMKLMKIVVFLAMTKFNLPTNLFSSDTYGLLSYQTIRQYFQES